MKVWGLLLTLMTLLGFNYAWAQETANPAISAKAPSEGYAPALRDERLAIKPMLGYLAYQDPVTGSASRATGGLALEVNFAPAFGESLKFGHLAIQTGILYSKLGMAGGDFYGDSGNFGSSTDYMLTIPADVKVGYNIGNAVRLSAHGGANVLYRSNQGLIEFGGTNTANARAEVNNGNSAWNLYPNVGADIDVGLVRHLNITVRPDWTLTSASAFFLGTIGVDFAID